MPTEGIQFIVTLLGTLLAATLLMVCRRRRALLALPLLILVAVPVTAWRLEVHRATGRGPATEQEVTNRPIEVRENEYVSSKTCEPCHPHHYATWFGSYHRTMTQVATPESVIGEFDGKVRTVLGRRVRLERLGDRFLIDMVEDPGTGTGPRVKRPVVMTTGFHHMQAYWYSTGKNRELAPVPLVYLREDRRWIPERSSFLKPPLSAYPQGVDGLWNRSCQQCHATGPQPRLGDMDTKVAELGIACEACHGPAERHVRENRDPWTRYRLHLSGEPDSTIVNPERLSRERASELCGQCHGNWEAVDEEESDLSLAGGFSYRPGDELTRSKFTIHRDNRDVERVRTLLTHEPMYLKDRYWPDGVLRVSGREYVGLLDSPCFNHGDANKKKLSCLDCHAMHQSVDDPRPIKEWANDQLKPEMAGDVACLQCHDDFRGRIEAHTHHPAGSSGSGCYNCHMPYTTYGLLKAIRSHTIDSPSVQESVEAGRPNACNLCHLDRTMAWTAEHLEEWYGIERPELDDDQERIAASILWVLKGDAGQRALVSWSMGWDPARRASRSDWMIPFLAQLLRDPYDAVRYIAYRSLRRTPRLATTRYDFLGSEEHQRAAMRQVFSVWQAMSHSTGSEILIPERGSVDGQTWQRLFAQRDNRRVNLEE